jgi:hypothetical protein
VCVVQVRCSLVLLVVVDVVVVVVVVVVVGLPATGTHSLY